MEKKTDLRIIKTYKALTDTFWQMLVEHKFEEITINDLCEHAMVRRATFYKHFADKNDFFAFVIREIQVEYNAQIQQKTKTSQPHFSYLRIIENSLDFLNSNKKMVQTVLESNMLPTVMDILSKQIIIDITQKLNEDAQNGIPLPASPQIMAHFFTGALVYTMTWWVNQQKVTEVDLLQELTSLLHTF